MKKITFILIAFISSLSLYSQDFILNDFSTLRTSNEFKDTTITIDSLSIAEIDTINDFDSMVEDILPEVNRSLCQIAYKQSLDKERILLNSSDTMVIFYIENMTIEQLVKYNAYKRLSSNLLKQ